MSIRTRLAVGAQLDGISVGSVVDNPLRQSSGLVTPGTSGAVS